MTETPRPRMGSLLESDDLQQSVVAPPARRPRWDRRLDARLRAALAAVQARPRLKRRLGVAAGAAAIGVAVGAYFVFRPVTQPDFRTANIDVLFNYTLLTDEFNKLPIEKRLELIGELVQRLKTMDADQSLLMAAFAAQITGQVRSQFEKNASLLAVDLFDQYARDYNTAAPPEDRKAYVEKTFIEFQKTLEKVAGEERNISDEERLIEGRRQAKRDLEFVQSGRMPLENTVRMITFLNNGVGQHASGHQKIRINSMISQMVQTLREGEVPPEPEKPEPARRRAQPDQEEPNGAGQAPPAQPAADPAPAGDQSDAPETSESPAGAEKTDGHRPGGKDAEDPAAPDTDEDGGP
ncbi:MAG: hypothetical protein Kow0022_05580 [Phycisphaerales bacterium]